MNIDSELKQLVFTGLVDKLPGLAREVGFVWTCDNKFMAVENQSTKQFIAILEEILKTLDGRNE